MRRVPAALLALLVVGTVLATPAPVAASSPPEPVCGVCGSSLKSAAHEAGVDLTVESSTVTVRIDDDGTGRWTARTTVDPDAAGAFREDPARLDRTVRDAFENGRSLVGDDAENVTAELDGDTVVVTFAVPEMAHKGMGGVLLVDYFNSEGTTRWVYAPVDRFEVRGPEGTVLVNDPPDALEADGAAYWPRGDDGRESIDSETYLAFGPDRSLGTRVAAEGSIAADAAPYLLSDLLGAALVPTVLMGLGVVAVGRLARRFDGDASSPRTLGYLVVGLAGAWVLLLAASRVRFYGAGAVAWTVGAQFAAVGVVAANSPESLTFRRLLAAAVAPPVVVAGVVSALADSPLAWNAPGVVSPAVTVSLFLPLGYATRRGTERRPLVAAIVAAPVAFTVPMLPIGGFGPPFAAMLITGWTLVTLVVGLLVYRLGWALAADAGQAVD